MAEVYIPKKVTKHATGRRIAIGDIHGCFFAFENLLDKQLQITQEDQIFLLGDIIDKGANSALVLDLIIDLQRKDYQIFPIKGNHEQKILTAYNCGFEFFENYLKEYNSLDLLSGDVEAYLELIHNFEYCIELDEFVLSHSGINEKRINPYTDLRGMFPKVNFEFEEERLISKNQVHGHLVRTVNDITQSIANKEKRFSIDSGCYLEEAEFGVLTALDLDEMTLYHQRQRAGNQEQKFYFQ